MMMMTMMMMMMMMMMKVKTSAKIGYVDVRVKSIMLQPAYYWSDGDHMVLVTVEINMTLHLAIATKNKPLQSLAGCNTLCGLKILTLALILRYGVN